MYLIDDNQVVNAEFSFDFEDQSQCIIVESSGGANRSQGVRRRNPDYNQLLGLLFKRLGHLNVKIKSVLLESRRVLGLPASKRVVSLPNPYPIDLRFIDGKRLRLDIGYAVARMYQVEHATKGGNAQKRIRIVLDRKIRPEDLQLLGSSTVEIAVDDFAPTVTVTEREYLALARIGQGQFRSVLLKIFNGACPVTGITNGDILVASHIKPWRACSNKERLDPFNGLLLSALVDRLFDRGLVTFNEEGVMLFSPLLSVLDRERCGLASAVNIAIKQKHRRYLQFHRLFVFRLT
jgi:hypothetical protein